MARGGKAKIKSLFYITHIENVPSILANGILSHGRVEAEKVPFTPIYDSGIVSNRKNKQTPDQISLWEYANLYFQPRNPMMYRVVHERAARDLAVIGVNPGVLQMPHVLVTDGNAANNPTRFFDAADGLRIIEAQWPVIQAEYWKDVDGSKRKIMAECLVPDRIDAGCIHTVYVADHDAKKRVESLIGSAKTPVVPEPNFFFRPYFIALIGENISLVEGDMFF